MDEIINQLIKDYGFVSSLLLAVMVNNTGIDMKSGKMLMEQAFNILEDMVAAGKLLQVTATSGKRYFKMFFPAGTRFTARDLTRGEVDLERRIILC